MTKEFDFAGLSCSLEEEGRFQLNPSTAVGLPTALVCGLAAMSYQFPEQKQPILDALTPFQIVSKIWSSQCVQDVMQLEDSVEHQQMIFVGSWFGQQSAMMARWAGGYGEWTVQLVDKDLEACRVAQTLLRTDSYHRRLQPKVVNRDIFELTFDPGTLFVWNGLEHFESSDVEAFLEKHTECAFVFQSTSMPANDHINLANDISDLLTVLPTGWDDGILYKGELSTQIGSRYMMAVCGPGFVIGDQEEVTMTRSPKSVDIEEEDEDEEPPNRRGF